MEKHKATRSSIALHPFSGGLVATAKAHAGFPDDSGPVLPAPPSRPGETTAGDFGGKTFLHLSPKPPKFLGTAARLLIASAPLPSQPR